jgi:hypothetical protein
MLAAACGTSDDLGTLTCPGVTGIEEPVTQQSPLVSSEPKAWSFAAYGDGEGSPESIAVAQAAALDHPQLFAMLGDSGYCGKDDVGCLDKWWNETMQPIRASVDNRFLLALGNHDIENRCWYVDQVIEQSPPLASFSGGAGDYSYDYENAHFLALDLGHGTAPMPAGLLEWVDRDLELAKERGVDWSIVMMHAPCYSTEADIGVSHGDSVVVCNELEPVFAKHGVDIVLAGHAHDYQRTFPTPFVQDHAGSVPRTTAMTGYTAADLDGAPIYFVVGTGGLEERTLSSLSPASRLNVYAAASPNTGGSKRPAGGNVAVVPATAGFARFRIFGRELSMDYVSAEGAVLDSFTADKR